ncbi:MAG: BatA domain-containing protein [Acidobacteria bacterium]|nr:BatA domain-containing protein [Acidobacteriota bacterium]
MGITFLQPWVWLLGIAAAVPIALHFLARQQSRPHVFPSLRFLEPIALSAVRWRTLQDLPLLAVRVAIILAAVAALAAPVIVTPGRATLWANRTARAIVLHDEAAAADDERRGATVSAVFARDRITDAVADAVRWLDAQSPQRHEIVIMSAFAAGAISEADLQSVPGKVGLRLVRSSTAPRPRVREMSRLQLRDSGLMRVTEEVRLDPQATTLREQRADRVEANSITVRARPEEQTRADAALRAVLRRGVRLPPAGLLQPIAVDWPGSADALTAAIDDRLQADFTTWEPERMSDEDLSALSRDAVVQGPPAAEDMGDRRIVWVVVLALLFAESALRGRAR